MVVLGEPVRRKVVLQWLEVVYGALGACTIQLSTSLDMAQVKGFLGFAEAVGTTTKLVESYINKAFEKIEPTFSIPTGGETVVLKWSESYNVDASESFALMLGQENVLHQFQEEEDYKTFRTKLWEELEEWMYLSYRVSVGSALLAWLV